MENHDLTEGSIAGKLVRFFLPIALGTIIQQLYNSVDAAIVGKYVGTVALAAAGGSAAMIINIITGFFVAFTSGAAVTIAHLYGAKRGEELRNAAMTAYVVCIICGMVITIIGEILAPTFLRWMKTPEDTMSQAVSYLRIYLSATIFIILLNMQANVLRACGESRIPFISMVVACVTNIVLDYIFVKYFHWGVAGAAWATVIAQIVNMALLTWTLYKTDECYKLIIDKRRFDTGHLDSMLHMGIPSGLQNSMYSVSNMMLQIGVNTLGTTVVAAWSLSAKLDGFYWAIAQAAGAAVTAFVAQNYGAGKPDRVKKCTRISLILFMIITIICSIILVFAARPVFSLLSTDKELIDTTVKIVEYLAPFYFLWAILEVLSGVLRGSGDAVAPVIITGLGICVLRVVWEYTVFRYVHTLRCICWCYPISWAVTDIAMIIYYLKGNWRNNNACDNA